MKNSEKKLTIYKEKIAKTEQHIDHLQNLRDKAIHREQLKTNGVDLKIAEVNQPEGFGEYEITTDEGLKFLSLRKIKPGLTYRVTKSFYETMQQLAPAA